MKKFNVFEIDQSTEHKDIYALFERGHYILQDYKNFELIDVTRQKDIKNLVDYYFDSKCKDRGYLIFGPFLLHDVLKKLVESVEDN